jgi:hypothetical protein
MGVTQLCRARREAKHNAMSVGSSQRRRCSLARLVGEKEVQVLIRPPAQVVRSASAIRSPGPGSYNCVSSF